MAQDVTEKCAKLRIAEIFEISGSGSGSISIQIPAPTPTQTYPYQ